MGVFRIACYGAVLTGRPFFVLLLAAALLASARGGLRAGAPGEFVGRVSHVIDGDTFVIRPGRVVRLAAIDAPERARDGRPAGAFAEEARKGLAELLTGREVAVAPTGEGTDRYGRAVAVVTLAGGRVVQEEMARMGLAVVYRHQDTSEALFARLLRAQRQAMDRGEGFWPLLLDSSSRMGGVVGNSRSLRFAPRSCPEAARIARRNRVAFPSAAEAFRNGYSPNRRCGFWPDAGAVEAPRPAQKGWTKSSETE